MLEELVEITAAIGIAIGIEPREYVADVTKLARHLGIVADGVLQPVHIAYRFFIIALSHHGIPEGAA